MFDDCSVLAGDHAIMRRFVEQGALPPLVELCIDDAAALPQAPTDCLGLRAIRTMANDGWAAHDHLNGHNVWIGQVEALAAIANLARNVHNQEAMLEVPPVPLGTIQSAAVPIQYQCESAGESAGMRAGESAGESACESLGYPWGTPQHPQYPPSVRSSGNLSWRLECARLRRACPGRSGRPRRPD